jgi:hypothetical protein
MVSHDLTAVKTEYCVAFLIVKFKKKHSGMKLHCLGPNTFQNISVTCNQFIL